MRQRIAIRANAGVSIGFGHIRRCISLADALIARGADVLFLVNPESNPSEWAMELPRHHAAVLEVPAHEAETLAETHIHTRAQRASALVLDSYDVSLQALANALVPVVSIIDAPPVEPLPVALVVNGGAEAEDVPHPLAPDSRALLGPRYVLLRPGFAGIERDPIRPEVREVLVMCGGSDSRAVSVVLARAARAARPAAALTVVAGPYFPSSVIESLELETARYGHSRVVHYPSNLIELMRAADLAVTTGGQTTYELAACGTPTVAVLVAANQAANLRGLQARGTLIWAGDADIVNLESAVSERLRTLATDRNARETMSIAGCRAVDGHGADRVAQEVLRLCA